MKVSNQKNPHSNLSSRAKFTQSHAVYPRLIYFQAAAFLIYLCKCLGKQLIFTRLWKLVVRAGGGVISNFGARTHQLAGEFLRFSCGRRDSQTQTTAVKDSSRAAGRPGKAAGVYFCSISALTRALNQLCYPWRQRECYLNWRGDTREINTYSEMHWQRFCSPSRHTHACCAMPQPAPARRARPHPASAPPASDAQNRTLTLRGGVNNSLRPAHFDAFASSAVSLLWAIASLGVNETKIERWNYIRIIMSFGENLYFLNLNFKKGLRTCYNKKRILS